MIRSAAFGPTWVLGFALLLASVGACARHAASDTPELLGTVTMPLTTTTNGHNYRVRNANVNISGNSTYLNLIDNGGSALSAELSAGSYSASLSGTYQLEIDDGHGVYAPVRSQLVQSYQQFSIYAGATTTVSFRFQTDSTVVTTGSGSLIAKVEVVETAPVCQPFSTSCGIGRWCPPFDLTGVAPACVMSGTVRLGGACGGPADCVANASCFDLGAGPVCAALCPSSLFNQACLLGGTCVPQGKTYGVCQPAAGAGGAGGVDGGGADGGGGTGGHSSACDLCTFGPTTAPECSTIPNGCDNCVPETDGCDGLASASDRQLCQDLYSCIVTAQCATAGDSLPCLCGTHGLTCFSNALPSKANGPCVDQFFAATKLSTYDGGFIEAHLLDPAFPLGRAVNLIGCRQSYCAAECGL